MANSQDDLERLRAQLADLTARIYRLEQRTGIEPGAEKAARPATEAPPLSTSPITSAPIPPPPPTGPAYYGRPTASPTADFLMRPVVPAGQSSGDLEDKIGKVWLNRVGIIATLIGVSYFLKYAFDNGWIGEGGRVAIGLLGGSAIIAWSERFRKQGHAPFSYSLKAIGLGTLYLSLWAASQRYQLVPASAAFVAMIVVTASTIVLSLTQDAEVLAAYAIAGGFSTPALVSTGQDHEIVLFTYTALLDLAVLIMVTRKPWRRLLWGSFVGTAIMFAGWSLGFYHKADRPLTIFFASLFFAMFAVVPLVTPLMRSRWHRGHSITLQVLPMVNAAAFFLALFLMYWDETKTLTWYALVLAGVYLVISSLFKRRIGSEPDSVKLANLLHVALAIAFLTIAIPLKLNAHWITIGWLVESAVLLWVGVKTRTDFMRSFAACTLVLGVVRLLALDSGRTQTTLLFNARFATYLVAVAVLGGIVFAGRKLASAAERPWLQFAAVALNVLALVGLSLEANDYFARQTSVLHQHRYDYAQQRSLEIARDFSFSAIWLVYGAGLMLAGFWKRSSLARWQALVLMAFTVIKVFLYDSRELQEGYRIISFIGLGVVLMAASYAYHRDWLKLTPKHATVAPAPEVQP